MSHFWSRRRSEKGSAGISNREFVYIGLEKWPFRLEAEEDGERKRKA